MLRTFTLTTDPIYILTLELEGNSEINRYQLIEGSYTLKSNYYPSELERNYCQNNGVVAFVYEGHLHVALASNALYKWMNSHHFTNGSMFVPFSNGDEPAISYECSAWCNVKANGIAIRDAEFREECKAFCKKNYRGGELPEEILRMCFKIPNTGIEVEFPQLNGKRTIYFPVIKGIIDCTAAQQLGTFDHNNGRVTFVYHDGSTYVGKALKVIDALYSAGYQRGALFVPFSNGEQIVDYTLRKMWENCLE